jgi:hypothetical protein
MSLLDLCRLDRGANLELPLPLQKQSQTGVGGRM